MFQFSALESTITYVIIDSHKIICNKLVNSSDMEEHTQFHLGTLPVYQHWVILISTGPRKLLNSLAVC